VSVIRSIDSLHYTDKFFGVDMSPTLFENFASLGTGVIDIDWDELS
jgi:hypothetical protein